MPIIDNIEGGTLIDDEEGLLPSHIRTKAELNEWEAANILKASQKYLSKRKTLDITIEWLKKVHNDMFDDTWDWAGKFRKRNYNIGIDWQKIQEQTKVLCDDIKY